MEDDGIKKRRHVGGATEERALSLSLPLQLPSSTNLLPRIVPVVALPEERGRDDVWSQGATVMLIDAWGDRYLELNRGNLKQKHWKEVADAVNSRPARNNKQAKTDVQCKNRLDTLKKKPRKHHHHHHSPPPLLATVSPPSPLLVMPNTSNHYSNHHEQHMNNTESLDMTDSWVNERRKRARTQKNDYAVALKEVASSIVRFGEVYERIEGMKRQQMMDLEKQRMEFIKDLELQRMQLFMHTQLELAKIKHGNSTGASGNIYRNVILNASNPLDIRVYCIQKYHGLLYGICFFFYS
ncbi:hypothetical protein KI387_030229 [Taxus chinensis]|uniref:Myb/SANT-like DNA-binding domain-containing protein n=1 Tax=Taxus chinensis TaxID=29808 RepID=A0AA38CD33_TAXCH|nr:hypothetical protein KI387_030229 [Taxus chinensis]